MSPLGFISCAALVISFLLPWVVPARRAMHVFWYGIGVASVSLVLIGVLETHSTGPVVLAIFIPGGTLLLKQAGGLHVGPQ